MNSRPEVDFDHFSPEFAADPAGGFRAVREKCPVAYSPHHGGFWVLTRMAEVQRVASDDATFSSARHPLDSGTSAIIIPQIPVPMRSVPIEMDPPESKIYRDMLNPLLSPTASEGALLPLVESLTTWAVDQIIEKGEADLILNLASPIPALFTLMWLGLPVEDWARFAHIQHAVVAYPPDAPEAQEAYAGHVWQSEMIAEAIVRKRSEPADDVISYLLAQRVDGEPLSDQIIMEMVTLLIAGGVDTTTSLTGQALMYLNDKPDLRRQLATDDEALKVATEEFLRVFCPVTMLARTVMSDVEVGGQQMVPGDRTMLAWYAANRDPEVFDEPETVRVDRWPNRHAAFGLGIHRCVGSNIARLSFRKIVHEVLNRMPDYTIDTSKAHFYPSVGINSGWDKLPATFTAGPRVGPNELPQPRFGYLG